MMAALFLTTPASIFIKILYHHGHPLRIPNNIQTESLSSAGKYIGILERLLVFTFIMVNHWEGVGFMVAAKSVFRFSDLHRQNRENYRICIDWYTSEFWNGCLNRNNN
jgi:hypothetical protein